MKKTMTAFLVFVCVLLAKTPISAMTHTVVKGDTLSGIAKQYYGDASEWREIFNSNKDLIKDPNLLKIGMILDISDKSKKEEPNVSRSSSPKDIFDVRATAYDLSIQSCGKGPKHPGYGMTRSGVSIAGKTRSEASCVAVDPKVIPIGSMLYITFEHPNYVQYSGVYQALDTGGGVRGRSVDIFLGDFNSTKENSEVRNFGVERARVVILRRGW